MILIKQIPIFVMIFLLSSLTQAQARPRKHTLRGIKAMEVVVENLDQDIEKDGLKKTSIQTDVELKLRMAGIKVLSEEEGMKLLSPYLYIKVVSFKDSKDPMYAFSISVELYQCVYLYRDTNISCYATTWNTTVWIGIAGINRVNELREIVKDKVDIFINDYLEMNPKE